MVTRSRLHRSGHGHADKSRLKKFHVWVFGSGEHFGNSFSKDFDNEKDGRAYVDWLKENFQKAYDRVGEYNEDDEGKPAPKAFLKKWEMKDDVGTMWVLRKADEVRLVFQDDPSNALTANVLTSFRASYNSDGDFEGYE